MDSGRDVSVANAGAAFLRRSRGQVAAQFVVRARAAEGSAGGPVLCVGARLHVLLDELTVSLRRERVMHSPIAWYAEAQGIDAEPIDPADFDMDRIASELALLRACVLDLLEIHDVDVTLREVGLVAEWFDAVLVDAWKARDARRRARAPSSPEIDFVPPSSPDPAGRQALALIARLAPRSSEPVLLRVVSGGSFEEPGTAGPLGDAGGCNVKRS